MAVDETKVEVDGTKIFVCAAVDCETLQGQYVDVTPDRSSLDTLLVLREVLQRCRGRPLLRADRDP